MKLPARDDPGGDREGALPRERVLHILEENDVETSRHRDDKYVLSLDDTIRVVILPDRVGGIMIRFLLGDHNDIKTAGWLGSPHKAKTPEHSR